MTPFEQEKAEAEKRLRRMAEQNTYAPEEKQPRRLPETPEEKQPRASTAAFEGDDLLLTALFLLIFHEDGGNDVVMLLILAALLLS